MGKTVVFQYEDIQKLVVCINSLKAPGIENAKLISLAADIIDKGIVKVPQDKNKEKKQDETV